jgi:cytochrome c peroxidase
VCSSDLGCHAPGRAFVDGRPHDVRSAARGEVVRAFDTPSLRFVGLSAPYYHDGRFATLEALLAAIHTEMGDLTSFTAADRGALAAYLRTL